uniref:Uncharacterized protein n=1 Tax=Anguilla anguilla TaxID=7936 RepID=A0A0E9USI7_ANGAN
MSGSQMLGCMREMKGKSGCLPFCLCLCICFLSLIKEQTQPYFLCQEFTYRIL